MGRLKIADFRIRRPRPAGAGDLNYGVWLEIRKPTAGEAGQEDGRRSR